MSRRKSKTRDYPDQTVGSTLAAEARKRGNRLSDDERDRCLEGAKSLIYARKRSKETAGAGR